MLNAAGARFMALSRDPHLNTPVPRRRVVCNAVGKEAGTGRCRAVPAANVFIVVLWWRSAACEDPESGARRDPDIAREAHPLPEKGCVIEFLAARIGEAIVDGVELGQPTGKKFSRIQRTKPPTARSARQTDVAQPQYSAGRNKKPCERTSPSGPSSIFTRFPERESTVGPVARSFFASFAYSGWRSAAVAPEPTFA